MTANKLIGAEYRLLGQAKLTIAAPATTALDFGTPDNLKLAIGSSATTMRSGDRIVIALMATTAGTTSTITWVIQDADDSAGSIGTPATAITDGSLAGGTGDDFRIIGLTVQIDRPWLKISATHATATDSFVLSAGVFAVPGSI